eukprot:809121-Prorocentrum_minimum.AAC.2
MRRASGTLKAVQKGGFSTEHRLPIDDIDIRLETSRTDARRDGNARSVVFPRGNDVRSKGGTAVPPLDNRAQIFHACCFFSLREASVPAIGTRQLHPELDPRDAGAVEVAGRPEDKAMAECAEEQDEKDSGKGSENGGVANLPRWSMAT